AATSATTTGATAAASAATATTSSGRGDADAPAGHSQDRGARRGHGDLQGSNGKRRSRCLRSEDEDDYAAPQCHGRSRQERTAWRAGRGRHGLWQRSFRFKYGRAKWNVARKAARSCPRGDLAE